MNYRMIASIVGRILCVEALFLVPAVLVSIYYGEAGAMRALLLSALLTLAAGLGCMAVPPKTRGYYAREGFVIVALGWIIISIFGALPFYVSGEIPSFVDCLFETVSGFTTTGASILPDPQDLSKGLLYWRSFTHWLGGMGVLVFLLAVDTLGARRGQRGSGQSMHLLRAESPGPDVGKLVPKMHRTAKILYGIYIGMTLLQMLLLRAGGMPVFDTVTTAFGTAGTGGFGIYADSFAGYSPYLQWVVTIFMALFGINFGIYYLLLTRDMRSVLHNEELRLYLGIMLLSTLAIAWNVRPMYASLGETLRHCAFQVSSVMTTTGFSTVDFALWPEFSRTILLVLMVLGACAGSTGGGIKMIRLLLLGKGLRSELGRIISPRLVRTTHVGGKPVGEDTMRGVYAFMSTYVAITVASLLLVSLGGYDTETTLSAVFACLNNIGPGLGQVGPASSYALFGAPIKLLLCLDMLFGRLEIFPLLMIFLPSTWRRNS